MTDQRDHGDEDEAAELAKAGHRHHREGADRGLPDGMALQSIAVDHDYDDATQRRDWESQLAAHQLEPNWPGSWNHPAVAATCELLLGESDGSWLAEHFRRQLDGAVPLLGREFGTGEYPSYVQACASLAMQWAPRQKAAVKKVDGFVSEWGKAHTLQESATDWLRQSLCLSALAAAPGSLGLAKGDALSLDLTVPVWGERCQGRVSSPVTPILARAIGLRIDEAQCANQVWLWPSRCADAGALRTVFTAGEQALLRGLVRSGELTAITDSPLGEVIRGIRLRSAVSFWRWERGGAVAVERTDNPNSTSTSAACWGPDGLRYLIYDTDRRGKIPPVQCSAKLADGHWSATAWREGGDAHVIVLDTAPLGRLIYAAHVPALGRIVVDGG